MNNITLRSKNKLVISCLLLLLLLQLPITSAYAAADHDWIVKLRQSPGTKACVEGGWTHDGNPIDHPGGFYSLCCDGEERMLRIPKEDIATEPNDADYDIRIWWPDSDPLNPERHDGERINAPGSKTYTHSPISVTFEVSPAQPVGYNTTWLVLTVMCLILSGGYLILRQRRKLITKVK